MEKTHSLLVSQMMATRDSLTEENWRKGKYFSEENGKLCMCVHGAGQVQVNPKVIQALNANDKDRYAFVAVATLDAIPSAAVAHFSKNNSTDLLSVWNNRPSWVSNDYGYGVKDLHFLFGMFGLTSAFNDAKETTLDMIKAKINEAIAWAEENGI